MIPGPGEVGQWSPPNSYPDKAAYSETGEDFVEVKPDGSVICGDRTGKSVRLPAGAAWAILACLARARG